MALRILLDNSYNVPLHEHSDLGRAGITIRQKDEAGNAQPSFSENITFYGKSYQLIADKLIDPPDARNNEVFISLYDDCCNLTVYNGKITADSIDYCLIDEGKKAACAVNTTSESFMPDDQNYLCLQNKLVSANFKADATDPGFQYRLHPFIRYCYKVRPTILHDLMLILGSCVWLVLQTLKPLVMVLDLVVAVINTFCNCIDTNPDQPGKQGLLDWYDRFLEDIASRITGCGEGGLSPYVRSYIQNACDQCGLTFSSSIFNDPASDYYNLSYFSLPFTDGDREYLINGKPKNGTVRRYFDYNAPLDTGYKFLNDLKDFFNADWWIENGVVHFEPKKPTQTVWIDATAHPQIDSLCYEYSSRKPPAFARLMYGQDAIDIVGNEAKWRFSDIVDYNLPQPNPNFGGGLDKTFPFGAQRYRGDGVDRDPLDTWSWLPLVLIMMKPWYKNNLYLANGSCMNPKLVIHDTTTGMEHARVIKDGVYYNWPMWFTEGNDPEGSEKPKPWPGFDWNLYRFWDKEDPRKTDRKGLKFTFSFVYSCDDLVRFYQSGFHGGILLPYGNQSVMGTIERVSIKKHLIEVQGAF